MGYISRKDQKIAEVLSHFELYYNDKINKYIEIDAIEKSDKFMRSIKMARTYTGKVKSMLIEDAAKEQKINIIKKVEETKLALDYTRIAKKKAKKMQRVDDMTAIETDDLYDIIDRTVKVNCFERDKSEKEINHCNLRQLLLKYDIPVIHQDPEHSKCPYKVLPDMVNNE